MVGQIIGSAQDYTYLIYLMPNGIPAWQRKYKIVHIGCIVQVENLLRYRMKRYDRFHSRFLTVDTDKASAFRCRFNMTGMKLLDVRIGKPCQAIENYQCNQ